MFAPPPPSYGAGVGRRVDNTRYFGILITGERISRWPLIIIIILMHLKPLPFFSSLTFSGEGGKKQKRGE